MGLYLCVFENDTDDVDLDGVEVGGYDDFHAFRSAVHDHLERGPWGSRFPVLMTHEDSNGIWTAAQAATLEIELASIRDDFRGLPPATIPDGWQRDIALGRDLRPASLHESFFDIDGALLLDRLIDIARLAVRAGQPISFQ